MHSLRGNTQTFNIHPVSRKRSTDTVYFEAGSLVNYANFEHTDSLAVILVYSIAPDSPVRKEGEPSGEGRYLSGLRSLESLERLITAIESFFHPSNSGVWTPLVNGSPIAAYVKLD
jgi:hypothetical protein